MSPDPKQVPIEENLTGSDVAVNINESDEDEDHFEDYNNYVMLPQSVNENIPNDDSEESESDSDGEMQHIQPNPVLNEIESREITDLWNKPEHKSDIVMDKDKEEAVMSAMAGFNLPPTAIPSWAQNVPEEEWKKELFIKLNSSKNNV